MLGRLGKLEFSLILLHVLLSHYKTELVVMMNSGLSCSVTGEYRQTYSQDALIFF